ncbi:phytoene desaturase family protein [Salmonirosea aquatica]|uniref:FAD-dependent oxidoreductase n=1 Tax=Salmonirosea aquatica TaxID=2654236 RepID=A0A7C9F8H6_9BACT|nr:FAD-dependent oxidoreductase [Cytophagaceae bacterium SJW1-29]
MAIQPRISRYHTVIIGGGHNGLVAANYLARAGKKVLVLEKNETLGGATASKRVFPDYEAHLSQYSYLVSLFPDQIVEELDLQLKLLPRRIASYTPYRAQDQYRGLLISHADEPASRQSVLDLGYGESEWQGYRRVLRQQGTFAELVWDSLLQPLRSKSDFEKRFRQAGQSQLWQDFVEKPIGHFLERHIQSDVLRGVLMTDAKIGAYTSAYDKSLLQNRTFIYHIIGNKTGEWRVPEGGMGTLARQLATNAERHGATLLCNADIHAIQVGSPQHQVSFRLGDEAYEVEAEYILSNASTTELCRLLGEKPVSPKSEDEGTAFKINMLLKKLPDLKDPNVRPEDAFAGTFHIDQSYTHMEGTFAQAAAGKVPQTLAGEMYCHTLTDPTILSTELQQKGYHTFTYFGLDLPYKLFIADPINAKQEVIKRFLSGINAYLAEPLEDCLARDAQGTLCLEAKSAWDLEQELNLPRGNIFHNTLSWFFAEDASEVGAWGVETPWERVLVCGSSAKRGGAVSGIPGRNAARVVLGGG